MAFNLEAVPGRPWRSPHYALIWHWQDFILIRLFPSNARVLVDKGVLYRYLNAGGDSTYVRAVRLDTHLVTSILNDRYLLDWMPRPPVVRRYPGHLSTETEILNHLSQP